MTTLDFLYLALGLGFLLLAGFFSYMAFNIAKAFSSLKNMLDDVENITSDISLAENQLRALLGSILKSIFGRR